MVWYNSFKAGKERKRASFFMNYVIYRLVGFVLKKYHSFKLRQQILAISSMVLQVSGLVSNSLSNMY